MHRMIRVLDLVSAFVLLPSASHPVATARTHGFTCDPVVSFRPGDAVGDSTVVQGHKVPRTVAGLKPYYPKPKGFFPFYPGERIVVVLNEQLLGLAVFDGCRLLTEFQPPPNFSLKSMERMEIDEGVGIPKQFRDPRGYRALLAQSKPRSHA